MVREVRSMANWCSMNGPFFVTVLAICVSTGLAIFKDASIDSLLPTILGLYLGQTATRAVSSHIAASRDPQANTAQVIREVEHLPNQEKQE